ncbi:MAG: HD domain-containing protein [Syntrophorhabdaceae bacterium]|nr:HD domain-containing protein [Syntrophorhabdaceae bacterium]
MDGDIGTGIKNGDELLEEILKKPAEVIRAYIKAQKDLTYRLFQIALAISGEKNIGRLLEMILEEAISLTNAEGGTLYMVSDDEKELRFAVVHSQPLNIKMGGTCGEITWEPVRLKNEDGSPNFQNVSAYAALSGSVVNIPDVYYAEGFNFEGTRAFDRKTGYRSKSMLVVPLRNYENDIIGVLQLLNARDKVTDEVIPFSYQSQYMTESLASMAAVVLTNNMLIHNLEDLLESFIKSIAAAIDEKSPYTGGHVRRVAELTMDIAHKINEARDGVYANTHFSKDEMRELRLAAWLHDVGKVTTPEHVVDKATKLETIFDRIELIKTRFEVLKRDYEIELLRNGKRIGNDDPYIKELEEDFNFLCIANNGSEFMSDEMVERLKKIASRTWVEDGVKKSILTDDEMRNLLIRAGTLTEEERDIISNHARVTKKMLSHLPFPKKLRNVAEYAGSHHERLDGSGYPLGIKGEKLPLQSRILALADIFEALTAKDRPYKKGKTLEEAFNIMRYLAKNNHIDPELFNFFLDSKVYLDYVQKELEGQKIGVEEE